MAVFKTRQEVIDAANKSLRQFDAEFWEAGFDKLIHRYRKCIALKDEYVERANGEPDDVSDDASESDSNLQ